MRCKHNLGGVGCLRIEPHGAFQKNSGLIFFTCHVFGEDVGVQKSFLVFCTYAAMGEYIQGVPEYMTQF